MDAISSPSFPLSFRFLFFFSLLFFFLSLFPSFIESQSSPLPSSPFSACYSPSASSIPIYYSLLPGPIFCPPGFYCPHLIPLDNRTWPIYCSPSTECAAQRGRGEYCEPQGLYEITICPKGYYCPELNKEDYLLNYNHSAALSLSSINGPLYRRYRCPSGYYCPLGSTAPLSCSSISDCPEGSDHQRDYRPLVAVFLIDVGLIIAIIAWKKYKNNNRLKRKIMNGEEENRKIISNDQDPNEEKENRNQAKKQKDINGDVSLDIDSNDIDQSDSDFDLLSSASFSSAVSSMGKVFLKCQMAAHQRHGLNIQFTDYSLRLPASGQQKEKVLLQGVTGEVKSGSVTAIMGPSGCGKTTFLNTMMGKIDSSWPRSGRLLINDDPSLSLSSFQQYIGYSPQDDVIRRDLSVYENLFYCASIRLPPAPVLSEEEKLSHINNVMEVMGLTEYRDSIIGTEEVGGGLSLEVRKRINIALELCAAPLSVFLDEPTTGLDSFWALRLTSLLQSLSRISYCSVVMIIHQPRAEIWSSLDNILLLAPGGRTVYQGPQSVAVDYFSSHPELLLRFEFDENPADILMDRIAEMGEKMASVWVKGGKQYLEELIKNDREGKKKINNNKNNKEINGVNNHSDDGCKEAKVSGDIDDLQKNHLLSGNYHYTNNPSSISLSGDRMIDSYMKAEAERRAIELKERREFDEKKNADIRNQLLSEIKTNKQDNSENNNNNSKVLPRRGASFFEQIYLVTIRAFYQQLSSLPSLVWECCVGIILGIIFGVGMRNEYAGVLKGVFILLSPSGSEFAPLQTGMFLAWLTGLPGAVPAIALFVGNEQTMYWREAASGHSKLAYFIGVNLSALPRIVIGAFHCATFFFITTTAQYSFADFYLLVLMSYFVMYGTASFFVMLINRNNATLVTVVITIITGIMNGYVQIIPFIVQWFCYSRWLTESIFTLMAKPYEHIMQIEEQSIPNWKYKFDVFQRNLWILFILGIGYRVLGYICMVNRYKEKQR